VVAKSSGKARERPAATPARRREIRLAPAAFQGDIIAPLAGWERLIRHPRRRPPAGRPQETIAMPTYEYECQRCGHNFEEFQAITAPARQRCPKCRGKVQRVIGNGVGILFKGSGFYVNDSRRGQRAASTRSGDSDSGSDAAPRDQGKNGKKPTVDSKPKDKAKKQPNS
jgi:putative FmdB family regulatory protein